MTGGVSLRIRPGGVNSIDRHAFDLLMPTFAGTILAARLSGRPLTEKVEACWPAFLGTIPPLVQGGGVWSNDFASSKNIPQDQA